ncbi:MAG: hypothetical protein ACKO96_34190, partial [Flammeovirgaceae bacterium]
RLSFLSSYRERQFLSRNILKLVQIHLFNSYFWFGWDAVSCRQNLLAFSKYFSSIPRQLPRAALILVGVRLAN